VDNNVKIVVKNKRAFHEYEIKDKIDAGIVLTGDEVKSLRAGNVSLADSYATIYKGEVMLLNCYIAPYSHAYKKDQEEGLEDPSRRSRKLLLHRKEINKLVGAISRKGLTVVPLKMYFSSRGYVKVELGIAKHKKLVDKKRQLKERDIKREAEREIKNR
jgi:SsrA-binding protein